MWITTLALAGLAAAPSNPAAPFADELGKLPWFQGPYFSAQAKAEAEDKLVFIAFWAEGYGWCEKLAQDTFSNDAVVTAMKDIICVNVDLTRDESNRWKDARVASVASRFPVRVFPTMFFVGPDGAFEDLIAGYIPPTAFISELARITSGQGTLSSLRKKVDDQPDDIAARLTLAQKYLDFSDQKGHDDQMAAIAKLDPEGKSTPIRRRAMVILRDDMESKFDDSKGLYDTLPMEGFLAKEQNAEVLFEGWSYLGNLYAALSRGADARKAFMSAWEHVSQADVVNFGNALTTGFWTEREKLDKQEKSFALDVATRVMSEVERQKLGPAQQAVHLDSLACCYYMNGKNYHAVKTIGRSIKLDPDTEAYKLRLEVFKLKR